MHFSSIPYVPSWLSQPPGFDHTLFCSLQIVKLLIMQFAPILCYSHLGPNSFLSILCSNALSVCSCLNTYSIISLRNEYIALISLFLWNVEQHQWVTGAHCFETVWWFHPQATKSQKQWTSIIQ